MPMSGQITVTTAGTAVRGPAAPAGDNFAVKGHPDNTNGVYVGGDGADVTSANGYPLDPGETVILKGPLSRYWFDADTNGNKIAWIVL